jgi:hypothetical protein
LDNPQFWEHFGKGNLPSQTRRPLILDQALDASLLKPLLTHLDFEQVLRDEDFFHRGQTLFESLISSPTSPDREAAQHAS